MQTRMRFQALGMLCLLVSAPFILWSQSDSSPWERYASTALQAYESDNFPEAERQLSSALEEARKLGPQDFRLGLTHAYWGYVFESQGKNAEADLAYLQAVADYEAAVGPLHYSELIAESLVHIGARYRNEGKLSEAQPLLERALALYELELGSEPEEVGMAVLNLAWLYERQERFAEAEPLYRRGLEIQERSLEPDHPAVADTLARLGNAYVALSRYEEAEPHLRRALAIREQNPEGEDLISVSSILSTLGYLYYDQFKHAEAEPFFKRALAIDEKAFGEDHPNLVSALRNLGRTYRYMRRSRVPRSERYPHLKDAEQLFNRALAISRKTFGEEHPEVAEDLTFLGSLYRVQERYAESEDVLKRALAIREKSFGPEDQAVADTLFFMANLYEDIERLPEAEQAFRRSLSIMEKSLESQNTDAAGILQNVIDTLHRLATILSKMGRSDEASEMASRAQALEARQR